MLIRFISFSILIVCALNSCQQANTMHSAYFGGEIVNAENQYVLLYNESGLVDSLKLDINNRFFKRIDSLDQGVHTFYHGGEYQLVLLEPNDSILLRLNTLDFDESLVFTGKGSKKNNFLINLFLDIEKEKNKIIELSQLPPNQFSAYVDSTHTLRTKKLEVFNFKKMPSTAFKTFASANINYHTFTSKEMYPFRHFGDNNVKQYKTIPKLFYNYRSNIDYNNSNLKSYFPYYTFMFAHFNNLALDCYFNTSKDSVFNRRSLAFNMCKLKLIDSIIEDSSIKNSLLRFTTTDFINSSKNNHETKQVINYFLKHSTDSTDKKRITGLQKSLKGLAVNSLVPKINLINTVNDTVTIYKLLRKKPTVLSFWSNRLKSHFKENHEKLIKLRSKYPNIDFISINVNSNDSIWLNLLNQYNYPKTQEFRFVNSKQAKEKLAVNYINRVILIRSNGTIKNANANMFNLRFEDQLKELH